MKKTLLSAESKERKHKEYDKGLEQPWKKIEQGTNKKQKENNGGAALNIGLRLAVNLKCQRELRKQTIVNNSPIIIFCYQQFFFTVFCDLFQSSV